mgnify:CR=1 FL=1
MSQANSWSDDNEHTLDMIRLNSVNLSEQHYSKYQQYKQRLNYVKYPVIVMSAVNAYAAVGLPLYMQQQYVSIGNTTVSFLVVIIVLLDMCMGTQKKLEGELTKYIEYKSIGKQIYEVLSLNKNDRKIDAKLFLDMKYKLYETLADTNERIMKFKDVVLSQSEKFINTPVINKDDPMIQKLHSHWNILFQPITYKLQSIKLKKNDVENQATIAEDTIDEIADLYGKKENHLFSNFFINPFKTLGKDDEGEERKDETTKDDNGPSYTVREPTSPTSPDSKSDKKFGMTFMAKI